MDCPKCGAANINTDECPKCGVFISKYLAKLEREEQARKEAQRAEEERAREDAEEQARKEIQRLKEERTRKEAEGRASEEAEDQVLEAEPAEEASEPTTVIYEDYKEWGPLDLGFSRLYVVDFIRIIYIAGIALFALAACVTLFHLITGEQRLAYAFTLFVSLPLTFVFFRIGLEVIVMILRISDRLQSVQTALEGRQGQSGQ